MKKFLLIVALGAMSALNGYAQDKTLSQSKADAFSAKAGTLIEKEYINVGKFKTVEVQVMVLKDLTASTKTSAIRFLTTVGTGNNSSIKGGAVDADELDVLIKSLKQIQSSILNSSRTNYTEVSFKSRSGFETGCYYRTDKKAWAAFIKLSKIDPNSMVLMTSDELGQMLTVLEQAKTKLV
ncbi:hypothetical protein EFA69_15765 [Rufibacter immobilis]|uniref:DUF4252 domain-containing protein n=1 Tax=Rufibacter immobilis TaxID=1348778 RepID=A0A3M9MPY7_9BACT|nr:hypothetical protein [Rufibacter immobilis]RNI27579.1 hypothetical protein EFA69_15765 [Rufibacter immobilis]